MLGAVMTLRRALKLVLPLAAAAGLVAGCGSDDPVYRAPRYDVVVLDPVFCYRTLARPDCYAAPQPGPPNRLIGRPPTVVRP